LACGLPGLLAAVAVLSVPEPARGTFDRDGAGQALPWKLAVPQLLRNPTYLYAVAGYVLVTFAAGAMADWFPAFLARERGLDLAEAGRVVGTATVIGGLLGTLGGGWLGDRLAALGLKNPYFLLSWTTIAGAAAMACAALWVRDATALFWSIAAAQALLWCYNGPINAILVNCVPSGLRVRAFSLSILAIHLFGDAISPPIVGAIADATGSLPLAVTLIPIALVAGAAVWWLGWQRIQPQQAG
jgi:sugar phosphate permease